MIGVSPFAELHDQHWRDLADSMVRLFAYYRQAGFASFNLALFIPIQKSADRRVHVRIVPRITIGALGTSDMNVLNYLHGEYLSIKVPEDVSKEAARFFQ